jgi:hypothetical protein
MLCTFLYDGCCYTLSTWYHVVRLLCEQTPVSTLRMLVLQSARAMQGLGTVLVMGGANTPRVLMSLTRHVESLQPKVLAVLRRCVVYQGHCRRILSAGLRKVER